MLLLRLVENHTKKREALSEILKQEIHLATNSFSRILSIILEVTDSLRGFFPVQSPPPWSSYASNENPRGSGSALRILALIVCLVFAPGLYAQFETASVLGTVRDESGAVLPGASVTLTHNAMGITAGLLPTKTATINS
jgi:hypothetical protein